MSLNDTIIQYFIVIFCLKFGSFFIFSALLGVIVRGRRDEVLVDKRVVLRLLKRVLKSWKVDEVCEFDERKPRGLLVLISICGDWSLLPELFHSGHNEVMENTWEAFGYCVGKPGVEAAK